MKKEIYAKKQFGQNFLQDKNIIKKIVKVFDLNNENIIEIGPGRGALTRELLEVAKSVIAFEIDKDMIDVLNKEFNQKDNFILVNEDFLKIDISNYKDYYIVANIPYYITTDILFKIFEQFRNFKGVVLMVQKEVAERIVAKERTKNYSKLSVTSQFLAETKLEFVVPASCFSPAPKVDSAIISFKFKDLKEENIKDKLEFFKLCFQNRRKKLSYSLKTIFNSSLINESFQKMGKNDNLRIQELTVEQIIQLYDLLKK